MVNETETEDLDLGAEKSGKSKLIIIIAAAVVLLVGGGVAAYFLIFSGDEGESVAADDESAEEVLVEQGPVQYLALDPAFVVTLPGKPSLLQVGVSVRFSSEELEGTITHNDPMIRHNLLNLLSTVDAKALKDRAAKEALQKRMLDELNRILKELKAPGKVDALYFTSFVMQ
ncbi:MAG: flagellar basal body-associated FliL family protein [Candidatus Thiodiazotropha sp.]|jgi:flagellar protein FliL